VVEEHEPCAACDLREQRLDGLSRIFDWEGDVSYDDGCAGATGDIIQCVATGVVLVVGDEELVIGPEVE
jgi:hypothetical protein